VRRCPSIYDADGERLSTVRFARMPEAKKATLKSTLSAEVQAALAQRPTLTVVKVADGAPDNWTFLATLAPEGHEVVDFFHAAEQLQKAFDAAYGEHTPAAQAQGQKYRHLLRDEEDGVEKVIRTLAYLKGKHPRRKSIAQVLGYFRRHRHRMGYAALRADSLPIGSGGGRGGLQDPCEPTPEALRDALAPPRRPGHLDAASTGAERALRPWLGNAVGHLQD
jgi:hypothetical protein